MCHEAMTCHQASNISIDFMCKFISSMLNLKRALDWFEVWSVLVFAVLASTHQLELCSLYSFSNRSLPHHGTCTLVYVNLEIQQICGLNWLIGWGGSVQGPANGNSENCESVIFIYRISPQYLKANLDFSYGIHDWSANLIFIWTVE